MKNKLLKQSIQLTASIMWLYFKLRVIHFFWSISFLDSVYYKRKRNDCHFETILIGLKWYKAFSKKSDGNYQPTFASGCVIENNKCEPIVNK